MIYIYRYFSSVDGCYLCYNSLDMPEFSRPKKRRASQSVDGMLTKRTRKLGSPEYYKNSGKLSNEPRQSFANRQRKIQSDITPADQPIPERKLGDFDQPEQNVFTKNEKKYQDPKQMRKQNKKAKKEKKEKSNNGNAFGKDKGELEGKEFGQERASQARMKKEEKKKELDMTVDKNEQKVKDAKEKIKQSKEKLENDKAAGTVTEEEYQDKKEKIEQAEKAVLDLETKINKAKEMKEDQ